MMVVGYKADKKLLEKYPEPSKERELLEKRIARHEKDIIAYVTRDSFEAALNAFHL